MHYSLHVLLTTSLINLSVMSGPCYGDNTQNSIQSALALQLTVTRLKDGQVSEWSDEDKTRIQSELKLSELKFQSPADAQQMLDRSAEVKQISANLTGEHLLFTILDANGKIRYQTIAVKQLTDSAKRAIQDAYRRQGEAVLLEQQIHASQGLARVELIVKLVERVSGKNFVQHYPELLAEIMASSEESAKSVKETLGQIQKVEERTTRANRLHFDLSMALRALPSETGDAERIAAIDQFISQRKLDPEMKQLMVMRKYIVWSGSKNYNKALEALEEARLVQPQSELAGRIPGFVENVRKRMAQADAAGQEKPASPVPEPLSPSSAPTPSQPSPEKTDISK